MKHIKRLPADLILGAVVVLGMAAIVAGVYLYLGIDAALIIGGVFAVAAGLLVDADG